jgi:putative photosynthetic complex assembly protein 2
MSSLFAAAAFAIFIWWFCTGLVLLLNRLSRTGVRASQTASTVLLLGALAGLNHTADQTDLASAYCAFTCALLAWGWNELSFLTGWITGPRKSAIAPELSGWPRFMESVRAILWHEIGILAVGALIIGVTWGHPNQIGTGTFLVLWLLRTSAKLNLFWGVRNLSEQFLPAHLSYLESFFRRRAMNAFWPVSVAAACGGLAWLISRALDPATTAPQAVGLTLVSTLLAMAIVEHLMLVLPLDTTALWRWALRPDKRGQEFVSGLRSEPPLP